MADVTTFGTSTVDEPVIVTAEGIIIPADIEALCQEAADEPEADEALESTNIGGWGVIAAIGWDKLGETNLDRTVSTRVRRFYTAPHVGKAEGISALVTQIKPIRDATTLYLGQDYFHPLDFKRDWSARLLHRLPAISWLSYLSGAIDQAPSDYDRLYGTLQSYTSLAKGWDGYDGEPASAEAVQDAMGFLASKPADIPLPYPELSADGEVGLYWQAGGTFAEVCFHGNGTFSYYAKYLSPNGKLREFWKDDCSIDANWPEDLLLTLGKLER